MLTEREVHTELRELLMSGAPFKYAHLIKFERPSRPDELSGRISTSAQRYTYLTDGSRDVTFDDRSQDLNGAWNGAQNYIANKILGVGSIQESVEAKADTCSVTLDGNGIGGVVTDEVTITTVSAGVWDLQLQDEDLVARGFREGDKITLAGSRVGDFNILKFRENNTTRVTKIDVDLTPVTAALLTISLSSEEIKSILLNKSDANYASFINREVYIYRAYFKDGVLVGATPDVFGNIGPVLIFKGIISNVSFDDDESGIKVTWGLTSHWGDFSQVRGRITSDEFHRALDQNGNPQPEAAIKQAYAYDKGFSHSDTSLNLLATYTVMVDKTTVTAKNGFFGIGAKTKVKTVAVAEGRNTALDFQLQAKSIPVIYGVRNVSGTPIFADTLKTNSSEVYVAYALSEGQIGGIYDLYIDGKSLICNNQEDFDTRSVQNTEGTIDLVCRGRADRGDVLGGTISTGNTSFNYYYDPANDIDLRDVWNHAFNRNALSNYNNYLSPPVDQAANQNGRGVIHGESISLTTPQSIVIDFFSGTEGQKAASQLVSIAAAKNFKVQNDYWTGSDTAEYWGPNHRLLDTAYVVMKVTIKEGETTIPDISYTIRGKVCDCFNYDYSYAHNDKMTSENPSNFNLGDNVTLSTGQSAQIVDKWNFVRPDGIIETRFRFSVEPDLQYVEGVPNIKSFTMTKGAFVWTMTTFNWELHSGVVPSQISAPVTGETTDVDGDITITFPPTPDLPVGGDPTQPSVVVSVIDGGTVRRDGLMMGDMTTTGFSTGLV
jgi:hypothetical protein